MGTQNRRFAEGWDMIVNFDRQDLERIEWQSKLDSQRSKRERNKRGQFATPYKLACEIMSVVKEYCPNVPQTFLEPSIGLGSFYAAFLKVFGANAGHALGFEIDGQYFAAARKIWAGFDLQLCNEDFFLASIDKQKFDLIVANPPYTRHHLIDPNLKIKLQKDVLTKTGIKMSGLAGLYCYFLMLSTEWLKEDALSCWLIPTEFMDVNYGKALKQYLIEKVDLIRIHRFESNDVKFEDALVNSTIVLFRNRKPTHSNVTLTSGAFLSKPSITKQVMLSKLDCASKWSSLFKDFDSGEAKENVYSLGNFFNINRGIATGNNKFFIVDADTAADYNIPIQYLQPVLPSPRYIDGDIIDADDRGDLIADRKHYLFSCSSTKTFLKQNYPGVLSYIEQGERRGANNGYICSRRTPWYSCEERKPAPIVVPYMGRGDASKQMFRFILNRSKAITTNVYLLLYPKKEFARCMHDPDTLLQVWKALNGIPVELIAGNGREYGGGLHKIEPRELLKVKASDVATILLQSKRQHEPNLF